MLISKLNGAGGAVILTGGADDTDGVGTDGVGVGFALELYHKFEINLAKLAVCASTNCKACLASKLYHKFGFMPANPRRFAVAQTGEDW